MKKIQVIKNSREFSEVMSNSKILKNNSFVFYTQKNNLDCVRVGISAPKKIGNAVVRNKIKRQVRQLCRNHLSNVKFLNLIIIVKSKYLSYSFTENLNSFISLTKNLEETL